MATVKKFENRDRMLELGLVIGTMRRSQGMSQEQLAERAGISRSFRSIIEAPNMVTSFSVEVLFNIADALNIRPGDLLNTNLLETK